MSELTPCNHCTLKRMLDRAHERGVEVVVESVPAAEELGGWISARYTDQPVAAAHFLSLPDTRVC